METIQAAKFSRFQHYLRKSLLLFVVGGGSMTLIAALFETLATWREILAIWGINGTYWVVLSIGNAWVVDRLDALGLSWFEQPVRRLLVSFIATMGFTVLASALTFVVFEVVFFGKSPLESLRDLGSGFFTNVILITLIVSLFLHGRGFLLGWRNTFLEAERLKQAQLSAQFESLRNQVNPHFLFNSLNVLSNLVYKDQDLAAAFIKQLSQVYRYVLDTNSEEVVSLQRELEALESYLFLLKIRFGDSIRIECGVNPTEEEYLAPLSLQMLVENAVKHNVVSRAKPLHISITRSSPDYLLVANNLQARNELSETLGIGLPNIQERYRFLSKQAVRVENSGEEFKVYLPLVKRKRK